ncbi:MAG TPA: glycoside hydrolase family 3 N-terminal domain-containing protein [Thermoanaerobaculia bacterium]|nr:glycoside hydrolase family 3 N-terminal domain-containing protein [Thermoanaerobaculia bacterium]
MRSFVAEGAPQDDGSTGGIFSQPLRVTVFLQALSIALNLFVFLPSLGSGAEAAGPRADQAVETEQQIDRMSPTERIGQLLFVGFPGTEATGELAPMLEEWNAGGVVLYRWNIESAEQLRALTADIRRRSRTAPFIAVDEEGGTVHRVPVSIPWLPSAMSLGAARSPELARTAGRVLGASLRKLGITMNLAPVLDIASNPASTLSTRLFSDRASLVSDLGSAFIDGQQQSGIIPVAKHYPGIGASGGDSHSVVINAAVTPSELRERELLPWRRAIAAGLDAVMTGHVAFPLVDTTAAPATLSRVLLTDILGKELGFNGVVITDEIVMQGLGPGSRGKVALRAIEAGADMVMVVGGRNDRFEAFTGLMRAYSTGALTEERVRQSLRRILSLKSRNSPVGEGPQGSGPVSGRIAEEIAEASVTLLKNRGSLLPLPRADAKRARFLGEAGPLASRFTGPRTLQRGRSHPPADSSAVSAKLAVLAVSNALQLKEAEAFAKTHPASRMILVLLGSPAELRPSFNADAIVVAYGSGEAVQRAVGKLLFGEICPKGRLPLTVKGFAKFGDGMTGCLKRTK